MGCITLPRQVHYTVMENVSRPMSPLRISGYALYEDDFDDLELASDPTPPDSLYSNLTLVSVTRSGPSEKGIWFSPDLDNNPASSSGTFTRLVKTTVARKPEKTSGEHPQAHGVTLNLHQFQSDSGDSLGEDSDSWARLKF
jgi:hypothetical protein